MTQTQLLSSVASATGESLGTIRALGFGLVTEDPHDLDPEDLCLVVDCPFCRAPVACPRSAPTGLFPLAECLECDVDFPFEVDEVYAAKPIDQR